MSTRPLSRPLSNVVDSERAPLLASPSPMVPTEPVYFDKKPPPDPSAPGAGPAGSGAAASQVQGFVPLDRLLVAPNVEARDDRNGLIDALLRVINGGREVPATRVSVGGRVIAQGMLRFVTNNGVTLAVGPGRWVAYSPFTSWEDNEVNLGAGEVFRVGPVTIVRVPPGSLGTATLQGNPLLLAPGWHAYNNNQFVLAPNPITLQNQPYIRHGILHILRVPSGMCAKIQDGTTFALLGEGEHAIRSATFTFSGMESLNQSVITHGTIMRYRVQRGEVALLYCDGTPLLNDQPGVYEIVSANARFERIALSTEPVLQLGSKKRIIVQQGQVGIVFNGGVLEVLEPGTFLFDNPTVAFDSFLSVRQRQVALSDRDAIKCETMDLVEIGIRADVFYKIVEPRKAVLVVGGEVEVVKLVKESAKGALVAIIRSSLLRSVAQSSANATTKGKEEAGDSRGKFLDTLHDQFIARMHDTFLALYGIEVTNCRVESFSILNAELSKNLAEQTLLSAKTSTALTNLEGQNKIEVSTQEREATIQRIKAETSAMSVQLSNQAQNNARLKDAEVEAEALRIRSIAQAEAMERENKVRIAQIQALKDALGVQGALQLLTMQEWARVASSTMQGVEKVTYLPFDSRVNPVMMSQGNPLAFLEGFAQPAPKPEGTNSK